MIVTGGLALAIPRRDAQSFLNRATTPPSLGVVVRPLRRRDGGAGLRQAFGRARFGRRLIC